MSLLPDNLRTALENLDKEFYDAVERRRTERSLRSKVVKWKQGADPYGLDWSWLQPYDDQTSSPPQTRIVSKSSLAFRRWSVLAAAVAAALLLGLFLGHNLVNPQDFVVAKATAQANYVTQRGVESLEISVSAPFEGFATVISLGPEDEIDVFPGWGDGDLDVPENVASKSVAVADGTTKVVFVVTETPAAEPIRLWLEDENAPRFGPNEDEALLQNIERLLQTKGYRRMATGSLTTTKKP